MKIYLAGPYNAYPIIKKRARELRSKSYQIISSWHDKPFVKFDECSDMELSIAARQDFKEVSEADLFIDCNDTGIESSGGKATELGIILALDKLAISVGRSNNIFTRHPNVVRCLEWDDIVEYIDEVSIITKTSIAEVFDTSPTLFARQSVLESALKLTCGQRNGEYGEPQDNIVATTDLFNVYLHHLLLGRKLIPKVDSKKFEAVLTASDVAQLMTLVKKARLFYGKRNVDTYTDDAAYVAIAAELSQLDNGNNINGENKIS